MHQQDLRTDGQMAADTPCRVTPTQAPFRPARLRHLIRLASLGATLCLMPLTASANSAMVSGVSPTSEYQRAPLNFMEAVDAIPAHYDDVWERLRAGYQLQ